MNNENKLKSNEKLRENANEENELNESQYDKSGRNLTS
jgi:hypothetical protein